jgi:hypothetical protein
VLAGCEEALTMINKPFDQIDKDEIVNVISNEVREGRMLDYKETLPGNSDSEKTEFLADVESVDTYLLKERDGKKLIPSPHFEKDIISALDNCLKLQETLGLNPPIFVMISLLDIKDYTLSVQHSTTRPIDRNVLLLPDVVVEEYGQDPAAVLRLAFDAV